ncbi:MAG: mechanosensitive ion channel, partial [Thiomargarita sp.]|nr:mechanosensitive ion channel [Thiomargarita sp.]
SNGFVNWTYTDQIVRITMYINISYDYDPHKVERIIQKVLDKTPGVLSEPKSWVVLSDLNEANMKFRIDYYLDIRYANWIKLKSDVLFNIWDSLKGAGISM